MKRTLRSTYCAVAAVALVGGALFLAWPEARKELPSQVKTISQNAIEQAKETLAPAEVAVLRAVEQIQEIVAPTMTKKGSNSVVLLSEPVIILGAPEGREALPKGTPVRVLSHHGLYVQVQHNSRVITIPRTAMVLGAYRTP